MLVTYQQIVVCNGEHLTGMGFDTSDGELLLVTVNDV